MEYRESKLIWLHCDAARVGVLIEDHRRLGSKFIGSGGSESEFVHLFHWYQN